MLFLLIYGTLQKKFLQLHKVFAKVHKGSFAHNVATNFKLRARMGCIIIYYVTCIKIANLLCNLPVCESVHEPFHAPQVSLWFIHSHASRTYALMYIHTWKHSEAYESNYLVRHEMIRELAHDLVHELVSHEVTLRFMHLIAFYKIN